MNHAIEPSGFAVLPGISEVECLSLLEALTDSLQRSRAGARHALTHPAVQRIANDHRLVTLASGILEVSAVPYRATLFEKTLSSNWLVVWHQDTALPMRQRFEAEGWGPWSVKSGVIYAHAPAEALRQVIALRLHLDPSDHRNGPLRVVPGSHLLGVLPDTAISSIVAASTPVECTVPRGGVLAMRPLLIHCSSKATSPQPRRVLHIEYVHSLIIAPGLEIATA